MTTLSALSMVEGGDISCQGRFERCLKVAGPAELAVQAGSGHINVSADDAPVVRVQGTITILRENLPASDAAWRIKIFEAHPPIEQHGNIIKIGQITDPDLNRKISISYDLVVPFETRLSAVTGAGSIAIEGLRGPVEATAGCGAITVTGVKGDVRAEAGTGEIEVRGIEGSVAVSTGSGPIHAAEVAGNFRAATAGGDVEASDIADRLRSIPFPPLACGREGRAGHAIATGGVVEVETSSGGIHLRNVGGSVRARTGSGAVRIEGEEFSGTYSIETISGEVTSLLPLFGEFEVRAGTVSGTITSNRPMIVQKRPHRSSSTLPPVEGKVHLDLSTVSGNIEIS